MTTQRLDRVLTAFRIGDPDGRFPIFDATGAGVYPGRWNTHRSPIICTSEHYSTAMLEKLVRGMGALPPNQHFIEITIPNGVTYEILNIAHLPDWDDRNPVAARTHGEAWYLARRSLILLVPSVVARMERNVLMNPDHPIWWDRRLFS